MGKRYYWYNLPGWTPYHVVGAIRQSLIQRGVKFEQPNPLSIKVKKGGLILWEGDATLNVYQQGQYIVVELSSSETRSFLTGGLLGRSQAVKARKIMEEILFQTLGQPAYVTER